MPEFPDHPRPDRPEEPSGREYPIGEQAPGGYHYPEAPLPPPAPPDPAPPDPPPVAAERFRRDSPARVKMIPEMRGRGGHWRLITLTMLFVMYTGSAADFIPAGTRAWGHVVFWAAVAAAGLATAYREQRNEWPPSPRWPWPAAAVCGTVAAELLVATVASPVVLVGSVVVIGLALFVVMLFG
ncbi:hypothetical protein ACFO4E_08660 [Nocardiopsis mangrovi]|uniref:Uncharacterized protein n=1 Tax=Nocardiopsis mangrovi TaxID=1179818 RepID=A0ABV9DU83_9ACTN